MNHWTWSLSSSARTWVFSFLWVAFPSFFLLSSCSSYYTFYLMPVIECPQLATDEDLYLRISGHNRTYGTRIHFSCPTGFKLVGSNFVTCLKNRTWSDDIPQCKGILISMTHFSQHFYAFLMFFLCFSFLMLFLHSNSRFHYYP